MDNTKEDNSSKSILQKDLETMCKANPLADLQLQNIVLQRVNASLEDKVADLEDKLVAQLESTKSKI